MDNNIIMGQTRSDADEDFGSALHKLGQLWDKVHMETSMRNERLKQVKEFQSNLLQEILVSEEKLVNNIGDEIILRRKAVNDLLVLFNEHAFDECSFPPGSVALLKALNDELNRLTKKRDQGFKPQRELNSQYELACRRLGEVPDVIDGLNERFLSSTELDSLSSKVSESRRILNERLEKAFEYQSEAKKIYDMFHHDSAPVLTEEEKEYMKVNLHNHNTILSSAMLVKLEFLCQNLKDTHDTWLEQIAFRYDELLIQLNDVSEKCFQLPAGKQQFSENVDPSKLNETELKRLEEQVRTRMEIYNRAQPIFDMLKEWLECWKQKLEAERRVCRASFYKNRGGSLNQKLKQRKLLDIKVPKLLNDLNLLCDKYVQQYSIDDIKVDGLRADNYASRIVDEYERERELQRVQKQIASNKGPQTPLRSRNVFGTTTYTSAQSTPTRSPAVRKLIPKLPTTVESCSKTRKRSLSCSQISVIFPLQSPKPGPRTSSPKPKPKQEDYDQ